jgi:hypothetical protein
MASLNLVDVGWAYVIVALGLAYVEGMVVAFKAYDRRAALKRAALKAATRYAFRFARKVYKASKAAGN